MATKAKPIKAVFKARDDSEHATADAAELHNKVLDAQESFKEASDYLVTVMKRMAMTADGVPFAPGRWDYWWIAPNYGGDFPRLVKVYVTPYLTTIDTRHRDDVLVTREYDNERREYREYPINELYADERKARAAWLAALDERLAELRRRYEQLIGK